MRTIDEQVEDVVRDLHGIGTIASEEKHSRELRVCARAVITGGPVALRLLSDAVINGAYYSYTTMFNHREPVAVHVTTERYRRNDAARVIHTRTKP